MNVFYISYFISSFNIVAPILALQLQFTHRCSGTLEEVHLGPWIVWVLGTNHEHVALVTGVMKIVACGQGVERELVHGALRREQEESR